MTVEEFSRAESVVIVDLCMETAPKEFNKNESCVNWLEDDLVPQLANEIRKHSSDIQDRLKKNKPIDGSAEK